MRNLSSWQLGCLVFAGIAAVGMLLDSWPAYSHWRELQSLLLVREQTLMTLQAREHQRASALSPTSRTPVSLLSMMTVIGRDQGMNLLSFVRASDEAERGLFREHAVCVFSGSYQQSMATLLMLARASGGIVLRDFSLRLSEQGEYLLQVDVMLVNVSQIQAANEYIDVSNNPFCAAGDEQAASQAVDAAALHKGSIRSMQMLAYLQQGESRVAWLRLDDGQLVQIQRGSIIGREQAVVETLEETGLRLIAADGRVYQIVRVGAVS